ncbi:MAG: hypothetical protein QNJ07_03060 [Woeseiaceae bacterium]|nr:hypothetical protein [Woeseiaceae bacterium]
MNLRHFRVVALLCATVALAGCFGDKAIDRTCDEPKHYESAQRGERIRSPDGLDDLEEYREMPIPEATNTTPRPAGSPCIDMPPGSVKSSGS